MIFAHICGRLNYLLNISFEYTPHTGTNLFEIKMMKTNWNVSTCSEK